VLRLIWYRIVGFLAGCVAKALLHTHLSITWTIVLGIVGSIVGGAVTSVFPANWRRSIPSRRLNRFHTWRYSGFVSLAQIQAATAQRIESLSTDPSGSGEITTASRHKIVALKGASTFGKLTQARSTLGWNRARSRRPNREKRPFCLHR